MSADLRTEVTATHQTSILIVDDSRVMRQALKKALKSHYNVLEAADGEQAWEMLCQHPQIQGLFTDLSMPKLDGYGLIARIRASQEAHLAGLPVIVITGKENEGDALTEVRAQGADDVLLKPFEDARILALAAQYLQGRDAQTTPPVEATDAEPAVPSPPPAPNTAAPAIDAPPVDPDAAPSLQNQLAEARAQLNSLREERDTLQQELEQLRTELFLRQQTSDERRAQTRIKELEQANAQAADALAAENARANEQEARVLGLQSDIGEAASKLQAQREQIKQLEQERADLHQALEAAQQRTQMAEQLLAQARGEAVSDSFAPSAALDTLSGTAPDSEALRLRLQAAELAQLRAEDEMVEVASRLELAEANFQQAQEENQRLSRELNRLRNHLREMEKEIVSQRLEFEESLRRSQEAPSADTGGETRTPSAATGRSATDSSPRSADSEAGFTETTPSEQGFTMLNTQGEPVPVATRAGGQRHYPRGFEEVIQRWETERRRQRLVQGILLSIIVAMGALILFLLSGWLRT
ncbi:response regulator [Thiorhodospira sibirica]|uniref:response regulator n=1 Tax=Thiorhodospira sibirica TaxID=154347 RepID=UPI0011121004|nr:response regulator [Thiorhodospira sibirica]